MKLKRLKLPKLERLESFLSKRFGEILLILILILVCLLSFKEGMYILSNDNYSPELNPTLSVSRYLESPAWRGYRVLGFASESEQADIFRSGVFTVLESFLPSWSIGQLFYLISMIIGSLSIASLVRLFVEKTDLKKFSNWGYLIAGVTYFTTLWSMWLFYQTMAPYISNFGFLPLVLLCIYRYIKKNNSKNALLLLFSSILFTSTSVIATLFVVDFAFIFAFTLFVTLTTERNKKRRIRSILKTLGIFLITQLFWILPFIHYTLSTSSDIIDSYTNRTITSSVIDLETDMQTVINSARFYNRSLLDMDGDTYVFPMAELFETYDFYKVLGLLPAIFGIVGIFFAIFNKHYKLLFWGIVGFISLFLIKALNPPLAILFEWLQEYIPLFKQVFRWPISKLGEIYLISLTFLSTFGLIYLFQFLTSFAEKKFLRRLLTLSLFVMICILQLIYSEYLFRGDTFPQRASVQVPLEYFELGEYLYSNDSVSRIYYAPPSNNNYFRKYEWGFWGSQFISYIVPNPMMDISLAIGSNSGEKAMLNILNVVRSQKSEEFLSLMQKYDVKYVLLDRSITSEGYSFDMDMKAMEDMISQYEKIWEKGSLTLYKVPVAQEKTYTESLSSLSNLNIFVKDSPRFPTLSPVEVDLKNIEIKKNEISGKFEYKGYSTYMFSNISKERLGDLPTKLDYNDNRLKVTPSYPYVYGDASVKPYRSYSGGYDYFVVGKSIFRKNTLAEGITIEEKYGSSPLVYGLQENSFKSIDMLPAFLKAKGSDCSGGKVIESTYVTPQEVTSGFQLKGTSESPCVYTNLPIDINQRNVLRVKINWETESQSYPGYCIFSETRKRCLNEQKYLASDSLYGEVDLLLNTVIEKGERVSLILYTKNIGNSFNSESLFRNIKIFYSPLQENLKISLQSDTWVPKDVFLDDENTYEVRIPVVVGENGYLYTGFNTPYLIWDPSRADSETKIFEVRSDIGLYQKVEADYVNQTSNLFTTSSKSKYLVYWKGENISNIPASLCLIYEKEDKCWHQDMLASLTNSSYLNILNGSSKDGLLNVIYGSTSYVLPTENILEEFVFMQYPTSWYGVMYTQSKQEKYVEYEMKSVFNSPNSTYYKVSVNELESKENTLFSIPQAKSSGWLAVSRDGILFRILGKDTKVSINDWKQAWDISNVSFDTISVIYWPNLLSYLGYILIPSTAIYLAIKLVQEKRNGNK